MEALEIAKQSSGQDDYRIVFDESLFTAGTPRTIALEDHDDRGSSDYLHIESEVTIEGPGADLLTIDGQGSVDVFLVDDGVPASFF